MVLEKTLASPLDCKEIQPVHPKGDQSWVFIGKNDAEAETPILWPPDEKSWLIWKDPDAGRDWGQEEKQMTEDKIVWIASPTRWTWVWVNFGRSWWTGRPGVHKESDTTEWLNWTEQLYERRNKRRKITTDITGIQKLWKCYQKGINAKQTNKAKIVPKLSKEDFLQGYCSGLEKHSLT